MDGWNIFQLMTRLKMTLLFAKPSNLCTLSTPYHKQHDPYTTFQVCTWACILSLPLSVSNTRNQPLTISVKHIYPTIFPGVLPYAHVTFVLC